MIEYIMNQKKFNSLSDKQKIAVIKANTLLIFITIIGIPAGLINLLIQGRINSSIRKGREFDKALTVYINIGKYGTLFLWPLFLIIILVFEIIHNFLWGIIDAVKNIF